MFNTFAQINMIISGAVTAGKRRFAICPMGANGMLTKQILNWRFGITEEIVIDNGLAAFNDGIYRSDDLAKLDIRDIIILLNTTNKNANAELRKSLLKANPKCQILNILEPCIFSTPDKLEYFKELRRLLKIKSPSSQNMYKRVGRDNDGGYVMLDDFKQSGVAYSFGIGDDVSWDTDIAKQGIYVYQYDHTINNPPENNKMFHFNKKGIGETDDSGQNLLSLESILKSNGHLNTPNMILKMDVEGAEWGVINSTSNEILSHFSQMTFELHGVTDMSVKETIIRALDKLSKTHQAIWIHGNNYSFANEAEGIIIPNSLEVTYINRDEYDLNEPPLPSPMELDMPCCPEVSDFILSIR